MARYAAAHGYNVGVVGGGGRLVSAGQPPTHLPPPSPKTPKTHPQVVLTGRRQEQGQAVADSIAAAGGSSIFVQGDVTVTEDVARFFERAKVWGTSVE